MRMDSSWMLSSYPRLSARLYISSKYGVNFVISQTSMAQLQNSPLYGEAYKMHTLHFEHA